MLAIQKELAADLLISITDLMKKIRLHQRPMYAE
jgi:hypothetical protein